MNLKKHLIEEHNLNELTKDTLDYLVEGGLEILHNSLHKGKGQGN